MTEPQTVFDTPIFNALVRGGLGDNAALVLAQKALKRRNNGGSNYWRSLSGREIMRELECSATEADAFAAALAQSSARPAQSATRAIKDVNKISTKQND